MFRIAGPLLLCAFALSALPSTLVADDRAEVPWANRLFVVKDTPSVIVQDFGSVATGSILVQRMRMTNIYQVPLTIKIMPPSCGCVSAESSRQVLGPLETAELTLRLETRTFTGNKAVTLPIYFSGELGGKPFWSTATLRAQAFIRTDITLSPGFVQFGVVSQGQSPTQSLDITYTGSDANWKLTEVVSTPDSIRVEASPLPGTRGKVVWRMTAMVKPTAPEGPLNSQIQFRTSDPNYPLLTVGVFGAIQSQLSIVGGNTLKLDPTRVGATFERSIVIRASKPFKVEEITGDSDELNISAPTDARPVQILKLKWQPTAKTELHREIRIKTSLGELTVQADGQSIE